MDRSIDSIGSCSLDVEVVSTDISDTSDSFNFTTPASVREITEEYSNTNDIFQGAKSNYEKRTISTQPHSGYIADTNISPNVVIETSTIKQPSYLNLACCVNGYSNITTYDSKIRQDINKSREVSPIRACSSSTVQYCKKSNSLAPPILLKIPNSCNKTSPLIYDRTFEKSDCYNEHSNDADEYTQNKHNTISFIQQRVERLYGPGALAQGFYSPRKVKLSNSPRHNSKETNHAETSELTKKFQELLPSKDYSDFNKKITNNRDKCKPQTPASDISHCEDNEADLPVMRHLSHEFRAQLQAISPKKQFVRSVDFTENTTDKGFEDRKLENWDEPDHKPLCNDYNSEHCVKSPFSLTGEMDLSEKEKNQPTTTQELHSTETPSVVPTNNNVVVKDGNHFLNILKNEQIRLLALATDAEKYIDILSHNPEASEDVLGFLRSASGKARLLVAQKLKQFEGLCHSNINRSPEDTFPTTLDDLQGFWDMVNLQIDHIDIIFAEINVLKQNDWKDFNDLSKPPTEPKNSTKSTLKKGKPITTNGSKSPEKMSAAALKRESQRKQLQEMKRKNRMALAANLSGSNDNETNCSPIASNNIAIIVHENNAMLK